MLQLGDCFVVADLFGSENNNPVYFDENGNVKTTTNHHGGSLGGITSGMPLILRAAFKPTPSIYREQNTIGMESGQNETVRVIGRHDPCIVPRAVPCVEAAMAVAILDLYELQQKK